MAERETARPDVLVVAFELIAERGWHRLSLAALAERSGASLLEVYRELPSREALFRRLAGRVDEAMLGFDPAEMVGLPPRDRVFELLMRRLDALAPFKDGLARLERQRPADPRPALVAGLGFDRSMAWVQEAAELPSSGVQARLARGLLAVAYLRTLRVWLRDRSADLARTMAELDKQLRRIESVAGLRERRRRQTPGAETPQAAA